ncbi:MAG: 4'-phosphopantetheinyl transferase superfamily protein [Bacteroidota bacterium]
MPLYKKISVKQGVTAYVWKVTEPENELASEVSLTDVCQHRMDGMKSELHRRAFLSIRHLLKGIGYTDFDLYYDDFGKPHLKDGSFISISHSHEFTGISVSTEEEGGLDLEKQRDKILRIAHKFTPIEEYRTIANTAALIQKLTIVWGAKESLYKIYATPGLSFLHHIYINDFAMTSREINGEIFYKGKKSNYDISFLEFEGFTCVYALKMG